MNSLLVIGAGPAGIFAAIRARELNPNLPVTLLERSKTPLAKVKISGGGRCNVTHALFDPKALVRFYPRGGKELLGPLTRFGPQETVAWFESRGVPLVTEEDGRMFPATHNSQTIVDCLLKSARDAGVTIELGVPVHQIEHVNEGFEVEGRFATHLLLATGSSPFGHAAAEKLGHTIVPLVPSLFTFNVPTSPLLDLAGVSVEKATLSLSCSSHIVTGPLLITHWGFSGPAALKLSAFAARDLHQCHYRATLFIQWAEDPIGELKAMRRLHPGRSIKSHPLFGIPKNLWERLIDLDVRFGNASDRDLMHLHNRLTKDAYTIEGKTTYKQEFVSAGGVALSEIHFKTMESKRVAHLYFAGEILDIDGVTGGFNFQNCWTTGFIAGSAIAS